MKKIRIHVSQEDINAPCAGFTSRAQTCPLARAIARAIPGCNPFVGIGAVVINSVHCADGEICALPYAAKDFIARFDCEGPAVVQPFTFDLEVASKP